MEESTPLRPRALLAAAAAFVSLLGCFSAPAHAAREIPVGGANVNDQNLSKSSYRLAIRFVLDRDTALYRFVSGFKAAGADWWGGGCSGPGSGCYGAGNGGTVDARLVTVRADGTPDLSNVLAQETFDPQTRNQQSSAAAGISGSTVNMLWYVNTGGVALRGDTMYAMVYRNVSSDPQHNFVSVNSPVMSEAAAGPNGRNNLDPNASGAVAGLDAREAVAWSDDSGSSWTWGRKVGHYFGAASGDDGTRLPWYGYQTSLLAPYTPVQPYYNYWSECTGCTLKLSGSPKAVTLTKAGGYAPQGESVGVVTVKNLRTGQTGTTAPLGGGMATGALSPAVAIAAGDSYTVQAAGTVYKNPADTMIRSTFSIGLLSTPFPFTTDGSKDRAEVFALPHPWFNAAFSAGGPQGMPGSAGNPGEAGSEADAEMAGNDDEDGGDGSVEGETAGSPRYAALVKATPGLLGYWRFGETKGAVAAAAAGGPNGTYGRGTQLGRPGLVTDAGDRAFVNTRGSSSSRVSLGNGFNFAGNARFTLEAWVAPAALDSASRRIFDRYFSRGGETQEYYVMATEKRLSFGRVRSGEYDTVTRSAPLAIGRRYHVVATYDGKRMRLWVNGTLAASAGAKRGLATGSAPLTVGAKSGGGQNFSGTIDDVAVYGGALPSSVVKAHYRAGIA